MFREGAAGFFRKGPRQLRRFRCGANRIEERQQACVIEFASDRFQLSGAQKYRNPNKVRKSKALIMALSQAPRNVSGFWRPPVRRVTRESTALLQMRRISRICSFVGENRTPFDLHLFSWWEGVSPRSSQKAV